MSDDRGLRVKLLVIGEPKESNVIGYLLFVLRLFLLLGKITYITIPSRHFLYVICYLSFCFERYFMYPFSIGNALVIKSLPLSYSSEVIYPSSFDVIN